MLGKGDLADALFHFEKKFKDKSGHKWADRLQPFKKGKYAFIERNYEPDTEESGDELPGAGGRRGSKTSANSQGKKKAVESTLAKPVQDLLQLIFNQQFFTAALEAMSYDSDKLPLGKLSERTLKSGYEALKELAELLANPALADEVHNMPYADAIQEITNSYYTYIPHSFGRNRPPLINNDNMLKKEVELLESLSDMSIAQEIMKDAKGDVEGDIHPLDRQYAGLGMTEMTPCKLSRLPVDGVSDQSAVEPKSTEYNELQNYLVNTHGSTHSMSYKVRIDDLKHKTGLTSCFARLKRSFASSVTENMIDFPRVHTQS